MHFARHLKDAGWNPSVYTPSNPQFEIKDEKMADYVSDIPTIRESIWEPFNAFHKLTGGQEKSNVSQGLVLEKKRKSWVSSLFIWIRGNVFLPDPRVFWVRKSKNILKKLIVEERFGTIVTTGPPHSMHLIGLGLKRSIPELKWISDFRDPWSDWDLLPVLKTSKIALGIHKRSEKKVIGHADVVLTVSDNLAHALNEKLQMDNVSVVQNGVALKNLEPNENFRASKKFRIGYFGMLNELRDPETFWTAIEELCEEKEGFEEELEIVFGGIVSDKIQYRLNSSSKLRDKVILLGYVPHERIFAEYRKCQLLLLLQNKTNNAKWILPVKFFEYLVAKVPILALGPKKSDLGALMEGWMIGTLEEHTSKAEIKKFTSDVFRREYEVKDADFETLLHKNSREEKVKKLIEILEKIA